MEEAEVLETVRRGWSGGTVRKSYQLSSAAKVNPVAMMEGQRVTTGRSWPFHMPSHPSRQLFPSRLGSPKVCLPNTRGCLSWSFSLFNRMALLSPLPLKPAALPRLTLHQKVDDDGIEAAGVGGCAGVVARVLGLHSAKQQCAVRVDEPVPVQGHGDG